MELQELDVAELGAGAVGQGPAVGGGHPRIGRDRVELAHAAGRKHDRRGANDERAAARAVSEERRTPLPASTISSLATSVCSRISISGWSADDAGPGSR